MGYKTQSEDTSEEAERRLFANLKRLSPAKRLEIARSLSKRQRNAAWAGLRRANAELSERQLQVRAVEIWYGEELAKRLEKALKDTGRWS